MNSPRLLNDFIQAGFKAIIVSVKAKFLGKEWLGRQVDSKLASELGQLGVDVCGEAGEFHTFVYDGPAFEKPVKIGKSVPMARNNHWTLDIREYRLG
jgi:uncharacterized protein (TIGR00290 family)